MQTPPGWRHTLTSCWVFPAVILWKFVLIGVWSLPPPANDGFFFDGAVVNYLRHGGYFNPSIARMFPTSGTEFFSAYVPGYQAVLWPWMAVFGPTAQAALWLHGVLFAGFAVLVLALLRELALPARAVNLGGLFLLGITFHDRPDSVAQVWGCFALFAWVRASRASQLAPGWFGAALLALVLCFLTNLHVGALYLAILTTHVLVHGTRRTSVVVWGGLAATLLVPALLAVVVAQTMPTAWAGLMENLRATPSITGLRAAEFGEMLKIGRTLPGLGVVAVAWMVWRTSFIGTAAADDAAETRRRLLLAIVVPSAVATVLSLTVFTANFVHDVAYVQPLVVALAVAGAAEFWVVSRGLRVALALAAGLVSVRAVGLTTWGIVCAEDVSRGAAEAKVRGVLGALPDGSQALVSSALLYAASEQTRIPCRHSDWIGAFGVGPGAYRPECLILSAFDYHRRYRPTLDALAARGEVTVVSVTDDARVAPPDAFPRWQRVVQHVSWAPVVVQLKWR
jgi:hypothetical protein